MIEPGPEPQAFRITGHVQGVGFRWWTRRMASELGINGTVRNAPDGSVEVVAIGAAPLLSRFLDALRRGPPGAKVTAVEGMGTPSTVVGDGFEIIG